MGAADSWDVYGPNGQRAGHNVIGATEGECAIVESWTSAGGNTGTSLNFYDRSDHKWRQSWMERGGEALLLSGEFADGHMRLQGDSRADSGGAINRITWTPAPDGTVKQYWDTSTDGGKTWKVVFDGTYVKVAATAGCESSEFHQLDFWIGDWDVVGASGEKIGANRIDRILKGCAVHRNQRRPLPGRTGDGGRTNPARSHDVGAAAGRSRSPNDRDVRGRRRHMGRASGQATFPFRTPGDATRLFAQVIRSCGNYVHRRAGPAFVPLAVPSHSVRSKVESEIFHFCVFLRA